MMQINNLQIVKVIDEYIRTKLFERPFDPFTDNNWKVLLLKNGVVTQHIVKEIGKVLIDMQQSVDVSDAKVEKKYFSMIPELRMRENYSLPIIKTIYEKLPYPSNKGGFEKAFMEAADNDAKVEALVKVNDYYHNFANVIYIRTDGFIAPYYPDFVVKTTDKMYIIETKSDKDLQDQNVRQKRLAILDWVKRVNQLNLEDRADKIWEYVLLGETHFYGLSNNGASIDEICQLAKVTEANATGKLFT